MTDELRFVHFTDTHIVGLRDTWAKIEKAGG